MKSTNVLDISQQILLCYHGDCLQRELYFYFIYLFCLLLSIFVYFTQKEKLWIHFVICILLLCIHEASWYRLKLQMIKSVMIVLQWFYWFSAHEMFDVTCHFNL